MKRLAFFFIVVILLAIVVGLCQPTNSPECFSGLWYSSDDQTAYVFQEGLIYSDEHVISLSDTDSISGAYTYCQNSIFLFVKGIEGLETEKELYLVQKGEGSFLCEHNDGSGKAYLIRYNQ